MRSCIFLTYFQGDVQTPVSILIVLKDKIKDKIDEATQENWFLSYIGKQSDISRTIHVCRI